MRSPARLLICTAAVLLLFVCLVGGVEVARAQEGVHAPMGADGQYGPGWEMGDEAVAPAAVGDAAVEVGEAGTVFRYVRQFGVTEEAYPADTAHVNFPWGVGTDGNQVWVAEMRGHRAVRFTAQGAANMELGNAGYYRYQDEVMQAVADVAVDEDNNIWIADGSGKRVLKFDASGDFVSAIGEAWVGGSDNAHFDSPVSIDFDSAGNVYVSDGIMEWTGAQGNHRIQVFDKDGNYLTTIGQTGVAGADNAHLRQPRHIDIFQDVLYVADGGNHRVQIINVANPLAPTYVATLGTAGSSGNSNSQFNWPSGVAVDNDYIYVADTWNHRVQVFQRSNRMYVTTIGIGFGSGNDQFRDPSDVAVDAFGNLYVADLLNQRVQQYRLDTGYQRTYGTTGVPYVTDGSHFNYPTGVAISQDGSIYVTEEFGHRLVKLDRAGSVKWTVGTPGIQGGWNGENDLFNNPSDVEVSDSGRVYVVDQYNSRIQVYDEDGNYVATYGNQGSDAQTLQWAFGMTVASNGHMYVADTSQHRVQIYDANGNFVATLGTSGQSGSDNSHFDQPRDVAVDSRGVIYVADQGNDRVQVFNANRQYVRTLGVTNSVGRDFSQLNGPHNVVVDGDDRVYIADTSNQRTQVFDRDGNYLTTIGGNWGNKTSELRNARGVGVDGQGNVFVPDYNNHRILKYAPHYIGWVQRNINGFGEYNNNVLTALAPFGGALYAGTYNNSGEGAQIWSMGPGGAWTKRVAAGFGDGATNIVNHLVPFEDDFYAGTRNTLSGGRIYRSGDGNQWQAVSPPGFGDPDNAAVQRMEAFDDMLYAGTTVFTNTHGLEIWRSASGDPGSWQRVVEDGLGDKQNYFTWSSAVHDGHLYFGTAKLDRSASPWENATGGAVIRSASGDAGSWSQVNDDGFGDAENFVITGLASFNGYLYAGTSRWSWNGAEIWRCQTCDSQSDWHKVMTNGFGTYKNWGPTTLQVFDGFLYVVVGNPTDGMEVWRSETGESGSWQQVAAGGFGDSNNPELWYNAVATYRDDLYVGTANWANAAEVWMYLDESTLLPGLER